MYKYFPYSILISLLISSCANQRNSSDSWDKKRITTTCDCADMAKDLFTEIIRDVKNNPGMTKDSIMNSKEAVWKPRFERCDEIEKERRKSGTSSFEEELEQCESAKELKSLMDTLEQLVRPQPKVELEIPENDSNTGLCECLVAANSEEEVLKCAPDKTIDELMEMLTSECLEMAEVRYEEEFPVEEQTEEALDPELMSLRRLDKLETDYIISSEEAIILDYNFEETELMILELKDSLLYFDKIPDFDTDLCQCWFNQGVIDLEEDCVDSTLYTLEEEQELYERLWPDCQTYDLFQQDLYILIDDYKQAKEEYHLWEMGLAELDIQIQEEELKLRFIMLHNLEEELKENQEIIQELKQEIIGMTQVIDKVDYRTCECILEYYDCTSSLDEINSIKKCDSTLSGEEIRTLCEQCEDRARASDNVWVPEGLLDEHKELEKEKIKKIEEIKKEIEQLSQDFPDIADQLNNEQEKQNTQFKQDTLKLLIEKRFNLDAKLQILKEDLKRNTIVYEDYLSQQYNMQQYIDQDMCDCILSEDEDTYENCTNGLTERDILCLEEECRLWRDVYYEVGQMQESLFEYSQERVDALEKKIAELDIEINILRKKFPHFAEKCERNLEENRINQEYTQRIKKWMSPFIVERLALEKEYYELYDQLSQIHETIENNPHVDENLCDCLSFSNHEECEEEFNLSKEDVDSIISLCEEHIFEADLFIKVNEMSSELRDIASGIQTLNDSILNRIRQDNENILGNFLTFEHFSEEKLRLVGNLLDQELMQNQKIVEIEERLYFDFDSGEGDALILKKEFIKEYDLLEDLVMKNKKTIKEVKTELLRQSDSLNRVSFYKNADLAFKAQEIFTALDEQDLDLFKSLVKQDTIDFFYWTIPSKDFTIEKLKNMSATIYHPEDSITVKAMNYLNLFKIYDMNLLITDSGLDRAAGWAGSCERIAFKDDTHEEWTNFSLYQNVSFVSCPNENLYEYMDPCEEIETLIQDPYRLEDALYSSCVSQDQLWFVFDKSKQKLIGIYDWHWSP